jgi:hypothetical protein
MRAFLEGELSILVTVGSQCITTKLSNSWILGICARAWHFIPRQDAAAELHPYLQSSFVWRNQLSSIVED